ncbi:cation:proton antiporter [Nocardia iowensis]|uniref:Cation:proton antiporter n=1 Tax=Nocardia iowensis TaxID=204891 RepID=A0ABX8RJ63_NOCIO|nr:cation:proton antiporter [Nocardia iowensis]QXN89381.1 cation:proton antiporter [Nocardia iowensis]
MTQLAHRSDSRSWARAAASYLGLVIVPIALAAIAFQVWGASGSHDPLPVDSTVTDTHRLYRLLLAAAVIVLLAHALGAVAASLGQPKVIGEMVAGILLGPTVFGAAAPYAQQWLFPAVIVPSLDVLAQFGVIFFMFLVGLELPLDSLRHSSRSAVVIGHAGIAIPFLSGAVLGLTLLEPYRPATVDAVPFVLFCGLALSITAFPVLARILTERDLQRTRVGALGLACAGVGDITAWCLLTLVIVQVRNGSPTAVVRTVLLTVAFGLVLVFVVRPLLARLLGKARAGSVASMVLLVGILVSALGTEWIGVHAIFGAFLAGAVMPRSSPVVRGFADRLEGLTMWLMLPLFFATVGLKTSLGGVSDSGAWLLCLVLVVVAMASKVLSTVGAGRLLGIERRESWILGVLMNCRGLTELVVLDIGLSLGLIGPELFGLLVLMALVTTGVTGPLLSRLGAVAK